MLSKNNLSVFKKLFMLLVLSALCFGCAIKKTIIVQGPSPDTAGQPISLPFAKILDKNTKTVYSNGVVPVGDLILGDLPGSIVVEAQLYQKEEFAKSDLTKRTDSKVTVQLKQDLNAIKAYIRKQTGINNPIAIVMKKAKASSEIMCNRPLKLRISEDKELSEVYTAAISLINDVGFEFSMNSPQSLFFKTNPKVSKTKNVKFEINHPTAKDFVVARRELSSRLTIKLSGTKDIGAGGNAYKIKVDCELKIWDTNRGEEDEDCDVCRTISGDDNEDDAASLGVPKKIAEQLKSLRDLYK
jgi:hypothetical protein